MKKLLNVLGKSHVLLGFALIGFVIGSCGGEIADQFKLTTRIDQNTVQVHLDSFAKQNLQNLSLLIDGKNEFLLKNIQNTRNRKITLEIDVSRVGDFQNILAMEEAGVLYGIGEHDIDTMRVMLIQDSCLPLSLYQPSSPNCSVVYVRSNNPKKMIEGLFIPLREVDKQPDISNQYGGITIALGNGQTLRTGNRTDANANINAYMFDSFYLVDDLFQRQ